MITGSCLCGKVQYQYHGKIVELALCHCSQCRKAQGGAFATNSPLDDKLLHFEGREFIKSYQSSEDKVRAFCGDCGSPLYSEKQSVPGIKRVRLGTIDNEFNCDKKYHIYAGSAAQWLEISDKLPQFPEGKPDTTTDP